VHFDNVATEKTVTLSAMIVYDFHFEFSEENLLAIWLQSRVTGSQKYVIADDTSKALGTFKDSAQRLTTRYYLT
jgi:hypothetical protein